MTMWAPRFESWDEALQDLDAVYVGPVMEEPEEIIQICTFYRLLYEEIVGRKGDAELQFC